VGPRANNLHLRICIVGHCGIAGHLSFEGTKRTIWDYSLWESLEEDIKSFCVRCLHCSVNDNPLIPRPLGEALHGTAPNQVLHYDCLYIKKSLKTSKEPFEYVLVLKDDFLGFLELIPGTASDHFLVADALVQWYSRFGMPFMHVSDQGSHFQDKVIKEFNGILQINHQWWQPTHPGPMEQLKRSITTFRSFSGPFCQNGKWNLPNAHFYFLWFSLFWIICLLRLEQIVPLSRSWQACTRSARCL
jgi:hypothetical protein